MGKSIVFGWVEAYLVCWKDEALDNSRVMLTKKLIIVQPNILKGVVLGQRS